MLLTVVKSPKWFGKTELYLRAVVDREIEFSRMAGFCSLESENEESKIQRHAQVRCSLRK